MSRERTICIGTRSSELALWQANTVKQQLEAKGYKTTLVPVKATGDLLQDKPLYQLGITGIFTRTLDTAMLNGRIDIAVHSMKDVPTILPRGIVKAAVLKRGEVHDVLVYKNHPDLSRENAVIATGSLRRKAQWLHRYPHHTTVGLRGNVNTRLQKLKDNNWDGAIFAKAGLERIQLLPENHRVLDWMIPAPAQGAMLVTALENDEFSREALSGLNHVESNMCTQIEREFLRTLEGGCTAPIAALTTINDQEICFKGALYSLDGSIEIKVEKTMAVSNARDFGSTCAAEILNNGGEALMQQIKEKITKNN